LDGPGLYEVECIIGFSGTVAAADVNNFEFRIQAVEVLGTLMIPALTNQQVVHKWNVPLDPAQALIIQTIGAGTGTAVYHATIRAKRIR
jgi:hypothetical protein